MRKVIMFIEGSRGYGRALQRGIAKYAAIHGPWTFYRMPAMYLDPSGHKTKAEIGRMRKWGAEGVIMRDMKGSEELLSMHLPTVMSTYRHEIVPPDMGRISVDYAKVGCMAADYLLNLGFRNFAFCGFDEFFWSRQRSESFSRRISEAGFMVYSYKRPTSSFERLWDREQDILCEWLKSLPLPIGLMACVDERAQDVVEACKRISRHIPEEIALIGCDNDELICELTNPQISSIALNAFEAGYEAAHLLDELMDGKKVSETVITVSPTHIVKRKSTEIIAIEDSTVANAVRFIREHAKEQIQVDTVVGAVATSRRVLERRFQASIGRSIYNEVKRVRIEEISKMLIETDMSITEIARKLHFESVDHISRFFKQEKNMSPLAFRKHVRGYYK